MRGSWRRIVSSGAIVTVVAAGVALTGTGVASASTVVTNCHDSGAGSLRSAVASGGTTTFALSPPCATITLTSGPITFTTNDSISGPGAAVLAVSGGGTSQVFVVMSGVTASIRGLTVENGDNTTGVGGGIDNRGGTVTVADSTVSGNTAAHDGGGICNGDGGDGSGTICDGSGTITVRNSTVSGNHAAGAGGGIANGSGTLRVVSSTISGNVTTHAFSGGGGIANSGGTVTLTKSTVSGNTSPGAFGNGGGIYNIGTATLTDSTVSANLAGGGHGGGDGGGIANFSGDSLTLTNSTVTGNTAKVGGSGGGIYNEGGTATLVFSTIAKNKLGFNSVQSTYGAGADLYNNGTMNLGASIVAYSTPTGNNCFPVTAISDSGDNLDSDGTCALGLSSDKSGVDPHLGALGANGGATQTMALPLTSPAVDAVPVGANGCKTTITNDQRTVTRPQFNGCDMGAYEVGDIRIGSLAAAHTSVASGSNDTLTATVLNGGAVAATGVKVTDSLPTGFQFVSAVPSVGSCSFAAPKVTCSLGSIAAATRATVAITVKATAAGGTTITDPATVTATTGDTRTGNDTKSISIHVT